MHGAGKSTPMIACDRRHLAARCRERGYTLDEVRPCIVSEDGDQITVDVDHPAYPRTPKPGFVPPQPKAAQQPPAPTSGPGTELKKLLKKIGITTKPGCACNKRAQYMDKMGPDWCDQNMDQIVGWLKEEHARQKVAIPFVDAAVRLLVKYAIRKARKKANSQ